MPENWEGFDTESKYEAWITIMCVIWNRGLGLGAKQCIYEGTIVSQCCLEPRYGVCDLMKEERIF